MFKITTVPTLMPDTPMTNQKYITFYQICQIKNPFTKKYQTRKTIFNNIGTILKYFENEYSAKDLKKFMLYNKTNKYHTYPVHNISMIALPNAADMMSASSSLTNESNSNETFGPAPF